MTKTDTPVPHTVRIAGACNDIITWGLVALVIFTPLAFGGVYVWAFSVAALTVVALLIVWLLKCGFAGCPPVVLGPLGVSLVCVCGLAAFQMVPLPPWLLARLSPAAHCVYQRALPGWPSSYRSKPPCTGQAQTPQNPSPAPTVSRGTQTWRSLSLYRHATKEQLIKLLSYAGAFLLIVNNVTSPRRIRHLCWAVVGVGFFQALYGLIEYFSGYGHIYFWRKHAIDSVSGTYTNRNHFAGYLEMAIPMALGMLMARAAGAGRSVGHWRHRLARDLPGLFGRAGLVFAILVMIVGLVFSQSRGGIISFLPALGVMQFLLLLTGTRRRRKAAAFLFLAIYLPVAWGAWIGLGPVTRRLALIHTEFLEGGRFSRWNEGLKIARDFPLTGTGLGTFRHVHPAYDATPSQTIVLYHAHNDYIEFLSETGIVGLIAVMPGVCLFFIGAVRRWFERKDAFSRGVALAGITAFVSIASHSITDFNLRTAPMKNRH
ncbi:O-antigen ligase family protein, partial [Thermodesulfobacteriota bacterium]